MTVQQAADALGLKIRWTRDLLIQTEQAGLIELRRDGRGRYLVPRSALPILAERNRTRGPRPGQPYPERRRALNERRSRIQVMLSRKPRPSAYQIAAELGVAVMTVYKDLRALGASDHADRP